MVQSRLIQNIDEDHKTLRCVADAQGTIVFVSPALSWLCGSSQKELKGQSLSAIMSVQDEDGAPLSLEGLRPGFYQAAVDRLNRDPQILGLRLDAIAYGDRKFYVIWFDQDTSAFVSDEYFEKAELYFDRVKSRGHVPGYDKLKAPKIDNIKIDESELRHFINVSNELFGVYRREGSFVRVNYAFNRVLGYADQDLRKFPFLDLIHPEDRLRAQEKLETVVNAPLENELRVDFESRSLCKDGQIKWIEWVLKSANDYIYIVGRDVSDIRRQEMQLCAREAQLYEAQKLGRMGHWSWEVGTREMDWSHHLYHIFGVEMARFRPTFENVREMVRGSGNQPGLIEYFQQATLQGKNFNFEFEICTPLGETHHIRCEGRCHTNDKTGNVDKLFGIFQDITDRSLHEKQLREAKDAAETAYASKTRFLANMSHELRTPLNAIIGFSEMMQRQLLGPVGNTKYLDYIAGIRESGEHLLDLINDILDMSKIEFGKYDLEFEDLNIAKVIRLVVHMMEGRAHESDVRLITDSIPDDLHIQADRRAVMQILINLMSNAVKFTPAGGQVEMLCLKDADNHITLIVRDTGVGIPKSKIPLVMLPFEQVASALTRPHEGSGLGLAITKDLVKLHHGDIHISSVVEKGTEVSVTLPIRQPDSQNAADEADGMAKPFSDFRAG